MNTSSDIATTTSGRRRTGTIARLPKILRDKINTMLDDGFIYSQIIEELGKSENPALPWPISEDSIGRWKEGGYKDYLRAQSWRDRIDLRSVRKELTSTGGVRFSAGRNEFGHADRFWALALAVKAATTRRGIPSATVC